MEIGPSIPVFILELIANALILWFLTHILKFKKQGFNYAFLITVISFGVFLIEHYLPYTESSFLTSISFLITPISFLIDIGTIKLIYREGWKKTLAAAIFLWVVEAVAGYIFVLIVGYLGYNILKYIP